MTNPLAPFLERAGVVVLDGGLATELERQGADLRDWLWSAGLLLEQPDLVREVHLAYYRAGADVATTASYQASVPGFGRRGLESESALELIGSSVTLAREARDIFWSQSNRGSDRLWPLVAGSVGPYGAALADGSEYRGSYGVGRGTLREFHRPRIEALMAAAPDLLALETFPSPVEAEVVLELLTQWPDVRAWVSYTCRDDSHVSEGQTIAEAARAVTPSPQVLAVGINCVHPSYVEGLLTRLRDVTDLPLVVYPNSGEIWDADRRCWTGGPEPFDPVREAPRWRDLGARLIGGCCRTTPATISAMRQALTRPRQQQH